MELEAFPLLVIISHSVAAIDSDDLGVVIFSDKAILEEDDAPEEEDGIDNGLTRTVIYDLGKITCSKLSNDIEFFVSQVLERYNPKTIICPNNMALKVRKFLSDEVCIETLPQVSFEYHHALKRVSMCYIEEYKLQLSYIIDDKCRLSVACLGGLLYYLERKNILHNSDSIDAYILNQFSSFTIVSQEVLKSLDIFKPEKHPCLLGSGNRSKEGFSLFSLLDRTKSFGGKKKLKQWLENPLLSPAAIEARLDVVELFIFCSSNGCDPTATSISEELAIVKKTLSNIKDVTSLLYRITECRSKTGDWLKLVSSLEAVDTVLEAVQKITSIIKQALINTSDTSYQGCYRILADSTACRTIELSTVISRFAVFDWEETRDQGRIIPKLGVNDALDEYRELYGKMDNLFQEVGRKLEEQYGNDIASSLTPSYLPSIGFIVLADENKFVDSQSHKRPGHHSTRMIIPSDFELQFKQKSLDEDDELLNIQTNLNKGSRFGFYKCPITDALDESCGDIFSYIVRFEKKIYLDLEECVQHNSLKIAKAINACSEIDVLLSFSSASLEFSYCRPKFKPGETAFIEEFRHPLIEHTCNDEYIPNTIRIFPERRTYLITGMNMSGKSALLKSVGMIFFMAQVGCFVPATRATLFLVDRIFTRIESNETLVLGVNASEFEHFASSFGSDSRQMARMIRFSTPRSLLLIDEFGKGTKSFDGASLLQSCLKSISKPNAAPLTLCATHLQGYLNFDELEMLRGLYTCHMKIAFDRDDHLGVEKPVPLYVLQEGISESSHGISCAQKNHLPESVVSRAIILLSKRQKQEQCLFHHK